MAKKKDILPKLVVPKNATRKQIHAAALRAFTAADLQRYTVIEPLVPAAEVLADLEAIHLKESSKFGKRKRKIVRQP